MLSDHEQLTNRIRRLRFDHGEITQQELAYLVGLSRQRVNVALKALEAQGTIRLEYGGLVVPDLNKLTL